MFTLPKRFDLSSKANKVISIANSQQSITIIAITIIILTNQIHLTLTAVSIATFISSSCPSNYSYLKFIQNPTTRFRIEVGERNEIFAK